MENTRELPGFAAEQWEEAKERIFSWAGGAPLFTLAQITDIHTGGNERYRQLSYLDALCDRFPFDVVGNFGDTGLDFSADRNVETDEVRETILRVTREGMDPAHPWLFLKGNHDRVISRERFAELFNRVYAEGRNVTFGSPLCDYGTEDFPDKGVRFLFLDTSDNDDGVHYSVTAAQLAFVIRALESCPGGWRVIAGSHFCLDRKAGKWRSYQDDGESAEFRALRKILSGFARREAGQDDETGLCWDFRGTTATLVCALAGDSHFNVDVRRDGVHYIARQGFGGIGASEMPDGATRDAFDPAASLNFDVLAIRKDGGARLFRVGAGAGVRDLDLSE